MHSHIKAFRPSCSAPNKRGSGVLIPSVNDVSLARAAIAQAVSLAGETGERGVDAELRRIEGIVPLKQSRTDEAERVFRSAIEIATAQEAKSWELRATIALITLLIQQNRRAEASTMVAEIYKWFTEIFDTDDFKRPRRCSMS